MAEGGSPNDASVLQPAIQIGVRGIAQILKVYQAGTEEVRKLLTQECEVIFECKVCRSLFRGLPNLIAHKRAYCVKEYVEQRKDFPNFYSSDVVTVMPEAPQVNTGSELNRLLVEPVPNGGNQKNGKAIPKTNLVPMLSPTGKSAWLKPKNNNAKPSTGSTRVPERAPDGENEGDENFSNVVKIIPPRDRETLTCSTCNKKFAALKSLLKHYNHLHKGPQTLYRCCLCPSVFTYQRSCRRHLERKHKKLPSEISKLMKMIIRKSTKVGRTIDMSTAETQHEKPESKGTSKLTNSGTLEVAGTEAKSNSNPMESAALMSKVMTNPTTTEPKVVEEVTAVKEMLTCPDCGKEFEKRSILDRHMKVCADYAKIAVTFDMSLVKGMQHLATNYGSSLTDKSSADEADSDKGSPGKRQNRRKAAPCRLTNNEMDSDVDSDARSVLSDRSGKTDTMPKLVPVMPLTTEHSDTISRPSGRKTGNADECLAKQAKLSNIETVLQFLKNPKKRSLMTLVGSEDSSDESTEQDMQPPTLEREDVPSEKKTNSELRSMQTKHSKLRSDTQVESGNSQAEDRTKSAENLSKDQESHSDKPSQERVQLLSQRSRSASESRTTRTSSLRSGDSVSADRKPSPRASLKSGGMVEVAGKTSSPVAEIKPLAQVAVASKGSKEYQEPKFEVIDLENKNKGDRVSRKRELSEERPASQAKRRDLTTDDPEAPGNVNRRAPRYASNFTTRRRQSMMEEVMAGVPPSPNKRAGLERRNSEPANEQPQEKTEAVSASGSRDSSKGAELLKSSGSFKSVKLSPKKAEKPDSKPGEKGAEGATEVDCDEGGVLRCMLMDADTAPKGRRKGALLPSHIAHHVNYEEKLCNICNKNFNNITELISHISKTHMNMKRYRCSLCSVEGMYFSEITRHIARTHRRAFRANHKLEWLSMCVKPINISSE